MLGPSSLLLAIECRLGGEMNAIWYTALPGLNATRAATVQLRVPVIAGFGGIVFLGETISFRLAIASVAILGGIALVILEKQHAKRA